MKSKKRENKSQKKKGGSVSDFFMNFVWIILVIGIISSGIWLYTSSLSTVSVFTTKTSGNNSYAKLLALERNPYPNLGECWKRQLEHYDIDMKHAKILQDKDNTINMKNYIIKTFEESLKNLGLYIMGNKSNNPGLGTFNSNNPGLGTFNHAYRQPQYENYNPNKII